MKKYRSGLDVLEDEAVAILWMAFGVVVVGIAVVVVGLFK